MWEKPPAARMLCKQTKWIGKKHLQRENYHRSQCRKHETWQEEYHLVDQGQEKGHRSGNKIGESHKGYPRSIVCQVTHMVKQADNLTNKTNKNSESH